MFSLHLSVPNICRCVILMCKPLYCTHNVAILYNLADQLQYRVLFLVLNAKELSQKKAHAMQIMMDYTDPKKVQQLFMSVTCTSTFRCSKSKDLTRLCWSICVQTRKRMSWDGNQQYLDGGSVSDQILQQQMLLMLSSTSLRSHRHTGRSYSRLMW